MWGSAFFSDDFMLLDKVRNLPFQQIWAPTDLLYGWYRPVSREAYFWTLERAFGPIPAPFHVLSAALWLAVIGMYWAVARSASNAAAATVSACGLVSLAMWSFPVEWASGIQELWGLFFSLLAIWSFGRRNTPIALAALVLGLLSKESAATVPLVAMAWALAIERVGLWAAVRRTAPLAAAVMLWAAVHPALGGRLWWAHTGVMLPTGHSSVSVIAARSLLALANIDAWPAPVHGPSAALWGAAPGALLLAGLAIYASRFESGPGSGGGRQDVGAACSLGLGWAVIGVLPLFMPSVIWQPYYTIFAACGAWIGLGTLLLRSRLLRGAVILALGLLGGIRDDTVTSDWSNLQVLRFGSAFMGQTERALKHAHPTQPRNTRVFLSGVPLRTVFVLGGGNVPALRVWYEDDSIQGHYWSDYRPRDTGQPLGPDLFYRFDSKLNWREIIPADDSAAGSQWGDAAWIGDHERLAQVYSDGGDLERAAVELRALCRANPTEARYAAALGLCLERMGEKAEAARWLERAEALRSR